MVAFGKLVEIREDECCAAVPGTILLVTAVPLPATTTSRTTSTTISGVGLSASRRGLLSPLYFSPIALCTFFLFPFLASGAKVIFRANLSISLEPLTLLIVTINSGKEVPTATALTAIISFPISNISDILLMESIVKIATKKIKNAL